MRTLPKGAHVMVQGSLRSREHDNDGVQRRIFELRADIENVRSADSQRDGAPIAPSEFAPTDRLRQGPGQPSIMRL